MAAVLDSKNVKSIVDFILYGKKMDVPGLVVSGHPPILDLASRVCWIIWLGLAALIGFIGWKIPTWISAVWKSVLGQPKISQGALAWISRAAYLALLWLLLITV
jgi:hypothetical protein